MASGISLATNQTKNHNVSHSEASIISTVTDLEYIYNEFTYTGFLFGRFSTNDALAADTETVLLTITDSLKPIVLSNNSPIVVVLSNGNQHKLHRGFINNSRQLVFYDSQSISGPVVFTFYVPVQLTY